jgi:hypothetical protein
MSMNQMDMGANIDNTREKVGRMGDRLDFEIETTMSMELPEGKYSKDMLNRLVTAINKFAPVMEFNELPSTEDDQTRLPMELVQMLMAITAAAEDAGMAIEVDLSQVETDRELATIIGQLDKLAKSNDFNDFLKQDLFGEEADEEVVERPEDEEIEVEEDIDEMFARRI